MLTWETQFQWTDHGTMSYLIKGEIEIEDLTYSLQQSTELEQGM